MTNQHDPSRDLSDDAPVPGLSALRDVDVPPSLVPGVMKRIAEPAPLSFWGWLRKPRRFDLALSPLGLFGIAAAGALGLLVLTAELPKHRNANRVMVENQPASTVVVRFVLVANGAHRVTIAGDFNAWDPQGTQLVQQDAAGTFAGTVRLPPGEHEYMFVVDGEWITDPAATEHRPDGFGRTNAIIRL